MFDNLYRAFSMCGYDLDEVMTDHTRRRGYTDLRSIAWDIFQKESGWNSVLIGSYFGWNRSTVFCAIEKSKQLKYADRNYRDLYDSIYGYYINFKYENYGSGLKNDVAGRTTKTLGQETARTV